MRKLVYFSHRHRNRSTTCWSAARWTGCSSTEGGRSSVRSTSLRHHRRHRPVVLLFGWVLLLMRALLLLSARQLQVTDLWIRTPASSRESTCSSLNPG